MSETEGLVGLPQSINPKVRSVKFNWRQVGSTIDRNGAGDDCEMFTVGVNRVVSIEENKPNPVFPLWNYVIELEDGLKYRIFNPNFVEYFPGE